MMPFQRPDPKGHPTPVYVGVYLINLTTFSEAEETFGLDCFVFFTWKDPRLAKPSAQTGRLYPLESVWNPDIMLANRRSIDLPLPRTVRVDPDGTVHYVQRMLGTVSIPLVLKDFPRDSHSLFIEVVSRSYGSDEVRFEAAADEIGQSRVEGIMTGWKTSPVAITPTKKEFMSISGAPMVELAGFKAAVQATRDWNYYALREVLPLVFIVLMASALFWLPITEHGMKIGVATAAIFSLMAYYVQLGRSMPKLSYLTRMDGFLIGATTLVFVSFAFVISGMYLVKRGKTRTVEKTEKWARVLFPGCLIFIFWASFYVAI